VIIGQGDFLALQNYFSRGILIFAFFNWFQAYGDRYVESMANQIS
jgi:hypothetical protein